MKKKPLAFFITFRCYGTWLHGDERGSTTRFQNQFGEPHLKPNENWEEFNRQRQNNPSFKLDVKCRETVKQAILETCRYRNWSLHAFNVRTNHVHVVLGGGRKEGKQILATLKANATRMLRESGLCAANNSPWSRKGSVRYIWDISALGDVVDYVLNEQGDEI